MATIVNYRNGDPIARASGSNAASLPAFTFYENTFDSTLKNLAISDIVNPFITIPAGSMLVGGMLQVLTGEASTTIAVGDSSGAAVLLAATSTASAGRIKLIGPVIAADTDTTALQIPKLYTADDYVTFTIAGAAGLVLKIRIVLAIANLG